MVFSISPTEHLRVPVLTVSRQTECQPLFHGKLICGEILTQTGCHESPWGGGRPTGWWRMKCLHSRLTSAFAFSDAPSRRDHLYGSNHNAISWKILSVVSTTSHHSLKEKSLAAHHNLLIWPLWNVTACHCVGGFTFSGCRVEPKQTARVQITKIRMQDLVCMLSLLFFLSLMFSQHGASVWLHKNGIEVFLLFFFFSSACLFSRLQRMTSGAEEKCLAAFSEAAVMAEWNAAPPEM